MFIRDIRGFGLCAVNGGPPTFFNAFSLTNFCKFSKKLGLMKPKFKKFRTVENILKYFQSSIFFLLKWFEMVSFEKFRSYLPLSVH